MDVTAIRNALDEAMTLEEGEVIMIDCESREQQNSIATRLYREKKALEKALPDIANEIVISRVKRSLMLSRRADMPTFRKVRKEYI